MTDQELKQLKQTILEIFRVVDRICREEKIPYFIIAGTALGAVRHGGFIPWDDDLDIGMLREDYERFLRVAPQRLGTGYFLQNHETDPGAPFYFTKIRKNGTRAVEPYLKGLSMHHGVFLDIFPFDAVPDDPEQRRRYFAKARHRDLVYVSRFVTGASTAQRGWAGRCKLLGRRVLHTLLRPVSIRWLYDRLDRAVKSVGTERTEYMCYALTPKLLLRRADLEQLEEIPFAGMPVFCPGHLTEHLTAYFGDYMALPPVEARVGHQFEELSL